MVMNTRAIDSRSKHIKRYAEKGALKAKTRRGHCAGLAARRSASVYDNQCENEKERDRTGEQSTGRRMEWSR